MKLRKFTAVSLTVAMTAAALTGCGSEEKEKEGSKSSAKEVSAESFTDTLKKGADIKDYDYEADINFKLKVADLFADAQAETAPVLEALGITSDEMNLKLSVDGSVKGTDAQKMTLGVEFGNIKGDLTDVIYVDDTLYVNVAKAVGMVETVADKFGMKDEIATYTTLLPEGDYISVTKDTMMSAYEALMSSAGVSADMESMNQEAVTKAAYYLMDEVEKVAKGAENAYSSKDGYSIEVNKENMASVVKSFADVFAKDGEEIMKNIEAITGDMGMSADDVKKNMGISTEEDMEEFMNGFEEQKDEIPEFSMKLNTNYSGTEGKAVWSLGYDVAVAEDDIDCKVSMTTEVKENSSVSVKAPESVMSEEDVKALLSLMGIDSVDDLTGLMGGEMDADFDEDYDFEDYDFEDDSNTAA